MSKLLFRQCTGKHIFEQAVLFDRVAHFDPGTADQRYLRTPVTPGRVDDHIVLLGAYFPYKRHLGLEPFPKRQFLDTFAVIHMNNINIGVMGKHCFSTGIHRRINLCIGIAAPQVFKKRCGQEHITDISEFHN